MTATQTLDAQGLRDLLPIARAQLESLFGGPPPARDDPSEMRGGFVNVTLRRGGLLYGSMGVTKSKLADAVREAVVRAARDERFGRRLMAADLLSTVIELWIELEREAIDLEDAVELGKLRLGWDGVRLRAGETTAYYKPSVAITHGIASPQELLERLSRKAGLADDAWADGTTRLERTTWLHLLEAPEQPEGHIILESLRPRSDPELTPQTLRIAIGRALARMLATQRPDGALGYRYDPFKDTWSKGSSHVRLAGCAYGLARAADSPAFAGAQLAAATDRLFRYLIAQTASLDGATALFIRQKEGGTPWGRLGATALAALAMQFTSGRRHERESQALVETLLAAQNADGSFRCTLAREDINPRHQLYFPGESLLALVHYVRRTGDERAARCIGRAFAYHRDYFRRLPHASFAVWQIDAWSRIAQSLIDREMLSLGPDAPSVNEICRFVFDQTEWLLPRQFKSGHPCPRQYVGGFCVPEPPTFSSAAFLEAIVRAYDLAARCGDAERSERYRAASRAGLQFIQRLQVPEVLAGFFPRPELALGATTAALESFHMRCDFDQHFVTACLTALESPTLWA